MSKYFRYVGHAEQPSHWTLIEDTDEAIKEAIKNGYTAISTTSFSHPPTEKTEPIRKGNLIIDIDCKENPLKGIEVGQKFVGCFCAIHEIEPKYLRCWLSGGKGCHIEIPATLFGAENGDMHLPKIYKQMIILMQKISIFKIGKFIDLSLYCMGKGKLLRIENIQRKNGCFKVPVGTEEFVTTPIEELALLVKEPRELKTGDFMDNPPVNRLLKDCYEISKAIVSTPHRERHQSTVIERVLNCDFITHCIDDAKTLSEPEWFTMIALLMPLGDIGKYLIHTFSSPHPNYSYEETEKKCNYAKDKAEEQTKTYFNAQFKMSCSHIHTLFKCTKHCRVTSPLDLWQDQKILEYKNASNYVSNEEGLFLRSEKNDAGQEKLIKISSPISVISKTCDNNQTNWGRLVRIKTSLGEKEIKFSMRDIAKPDVFLGELLDAGLEITDLHFAKKHLSNYIMNTSCPEGVVLMTKMLGWYSDNDSYILPDEVFGSIDLPVQFSGKMSENFHKKSGELSDWQEQIGVLCQGNSLLVFLTSLALVGPMLKLCSEEGIGFNVYGPSSSGKTTCALVAGSVCGGGGRNGYARSWRTTDNALETTAALHNDNLLVLDELGQATGDSVGKTIYMLINGESKMRMRSDISLREAAQWRVNILSTGELTISEKIQESGKFKSMIGQEVRVVDLSVLGMNGKQVFENLHGFESGAQLSKVLSERSKEYFGSPFRSFLKELCTKQEEYRDRILQDVESFEKDVIPFKSSGQLQRVGRKFALVAAVGELARELGIFPYAEGEVYDAAKKWFKVWLDARPGIGNLEIEKTIQNIMNTIETKGMTNFVLLENSKADYFHGDLFGYRWQEGNTFIYFILSSVFTRLCSGSNRDAIIQELAKRGQVKLNGADKIMETKTVNKQNQRGIGILVPYAANEKCVVNEKNGFHISKDIDLYLSS